MELKIADLKIHRFVPEDGSACNAIQLTHKTSRRKIINDHTTSQRENLRRAMRELCDQLNPHPDHIEPTDLFIFDCVKIHLPEALHEGEVHRLSWDFVIRRWKYFVECRNAAVTTWYDRDDLELLEIEPD